MQRVAVVFVNLVDVVVFPKSIEVTKVVEVSYWALALFKKESKYDAVVSNTKSSPYIGYFFLDATTLSLYRHWQMMKSSAKNFGNSSVLMLIAGVPNTIQRGFLPSSKTMLYLALDNLAFSFQKTKYWV